MPEMRGRPIEEKTISNIVPNKLGSYIFRHSEIQPNRRYSVKIFTTKYSKNSKELRKWVTMPKPAVRPRTPIAFTVSGTTINSIVIAWRVAVGDTVPDNWQVLPTFYEYRMEKQHCPKICF